MHKSLALCFCICISVASLKVIALSTKTWWWLVRSPLPTQITLMYSNYWNIDQPLGKRKSYPQVMFTKVQDIPWVCGLFSSAYLPVTWCHNWAQPSRTDSGSPLHWIAICNTGDAGDLLTFPDVIENRDDYFSKLTVRTFAFKTLFWHSRGSQWSLCSSLNTILN